MTHLLTHRAALAAAVFVPALLSAPLVKAGPVENFSRLVAHPTDPNVLVAMYDQAFGGFFYSTDGGQTFKMRPSSAIGTPAVYFSKDNPPPMLVTGQGKILVGDTSKLLIASDKGCDFNVPPELDGMWIGALALDPADPNVAYIAQASQTKQAYDANGQVVTTTQAGSLWKLAADGTLAKVGVEDATDLKATGGMSIVKLPGGGMRIVQAAAQDVFDADKGYVTGSTPVLRYSDDGAQSWTLVDAPTPPAGAPLRLLAVDPQNPDTFVISFRDAKGTPNNVDPVYVSTDAGKTFAPLFGPITGVGQALFAPDGSFWLTDTGDLSYEDAPKGVWHATSWDEAGATKVSEEPAYGVAIDQAKGELWVALRYQLGQMPLDGSGFCEMFSIHDSIDFLECDGEDLTQKKEVLDQSCQQYCNATHSWCAPLCSRWGTSHELCGPAVVGTEWQQTLPAASKYPRCDGFPAMTEGCELFMSGGGGVADAGAPVDAGGGQKSPDAGVVSTLDAGSDPIQLPSGGGGGGCSVGFDSAPSRNTAFGLSILAGLGLMMARRRRRD